MKQRINLCQELVELLDRDHMQVIKGGSGLDGLNGGASCTEFNNAETCRVI